MNNLWLEIRDIHAFCDRECIINVKESKIKKSNGNFQC